MQTAKQYMEMADRLLAGAYHVLEPFSALTGNEAVAHQRAIIELARALQEQARILRADPMLADYPGSSTTNPGRS